MKRILALFSSLFILAGLKAQTTPAVKKETVKPAVVKPAVSDTAKKTLKTTSNTLKKSNSTFKNAKAAYDDESPKETKIIKQTIKKAPAVTSKPMKE
ncbi:MAG: hypothetical protein JSU05_11940 [Bacteroidetes bacterium]|nr:hypothetical protein [Bacteroidota bacterium]